MQYGNLQNKSVWFWVASVAVIAAVAVGFDYFQWRSSALNEKAAAPDISQTNTADSESPKPVQPTPPKTVIKPKAVIPTAPVAVQPIPESAPVIVPSVNHSGTWGGTFISAAPSQCAGFSGTLTMHLSDSSGALAGDFSASDGTAGSLKGSVKDENFSANILSGDVVVLTLSGKMTASNLSGNFSRVQECSSGSGPVSGTLSANKN